MVHAQQERHSDQHGQYLDVNSELIRTCGPSSRAPRLSGVAAAPAGKTSVGLEFVEVPAFLVRLCLGGGGAASELLTANELADRAALDVGR